MAGGEILDETYQSLIQWKPPRILAPKTSLPLAQDTVVALDPYVCELKDSGKLSPCSIDSGFVEEDYQIANGLNLSHCEVIEPLSSERNSQHNSQLTPSQNFQGNAVESQAQSQREALVTAVTPKDLYSGNVEPTTPSLASIQLALNGNMSTIPNLSGRAASSV